MQKSVSTEVRRNDAIRAALRGGRSATVELMEVATPRLVSLANSVPRPPQIVLNRFAATAFERQLIDALGGEHNSEIISVIIDGRRVNIIPDMWGRAAGGVLEIKEVLDLSLRRQLRAQLDYALRNNLPYNLVVSSRTQTISGPLRAQIDAVNRNYMRHSGAADGAGSLSLTLSQIR